LAVSAVVEPTPHGLARFGQRERQRVPDDLTAMIGDQAQRLVLADIDPRRQAPRRF